MDDRACSRTVIGISTVGDVGNGNSVAFNNFHSRGVVLSGRTPSYFRN